MSQQQNSLLDTSGLYSEVLPREQRTYLRWDNINCYVPASRHEVKVF